jgi:hypothetical protein
MSVSALFWYILFNDRKGESVEWYEGMIEKAKGFIEKGEPLQPVLFLKHKKGSIGIVHLGRFTNDKDALSFMLRAAVRAEDPDEYMFLTEAYVKTFDQRDGGDYAIGKLIVDGTLKVSQVPSSKECITVLFGDRKAEKLGTIIFEKKGGLVAFEPIQWIEFDEMKGRFTGLRSRGSSSDHKSV